MTDRTRVLAALVVGLAVGCGGDPPPPAAGTKSITWAEFDRMPPEEQADPYVLAHLDDDARTKLAEKAKARPKK